MLFSGKTFSYEYGLKDSDIILLGVPFSSTETGHSVKYGPLFIREAIRNLVGWDPELKLNVFEELKFCDLGDIEVVPGSWKLTEERLVETVKSMLQENPKAFPVFLGGEHLMTLGIVKALAEIKGSFTIVHLDAHRDLKKDWMGEPYSHITWAHHAMKTDGIKLVQLGCRIWDPDEEDAFRELGVKETLDGIEGPVYLTVDMDVFDPSIAPEVGTPQPGGLSLEKGLEIIREVCKNEIIGMDINECASRSVDSRTAVLAAEIFKKVLGYRRKHGKG